MTRRFERANAAVELALILPMLLMLTLGAVDFGRLFYAYIAVSNSAHQAAVYASRPNGGGWDNPPHPILLTVIGNETNGFLTAGNSSVVLTEVTGAKIRMAKVRVVHNFSPVSPIPLPGPIQVAATASAPMLVN